MVAPSWSLQVRQVGAANPVRIDTGEIRINETMIAMSGVVVTDLKKGEARGARGGQLPPAVHRPAVGARQGLVRRRAVIRSRSSAAWAKSQSLEDLRGTHLCGAH